MYYSHTTVFIVRIPEICAINSVYNILYYVQFHSEFKAVTD